MKTFWTILRSLLLLRLKDSTDRRWRAAASVLLTAMAIGHPCVLHIALAGLYAGTVLLVPSDKALAAAKERRALKGASP